MGDIDILIGSDEALIIDYYRGLTESEQGKFREMLSFIVEHPEIALPVPEPDLSMPSQVLAYLREKSLN